jgi:hypothetical protein
MLQDEERGWGSPSLSPCRAAGACGEPTKKRCRTDGGEPAGRTLASSPLCAELDVPHLSSDHLLFHEVLVPRPWKLPAQAVFAGENFVLSGPLTPGEFVGHLDAIAVGIVEIDAH